MQHLFWVALAALLGSVALPAQATITVHNQWHLGEADSGAAAGGAGAAATVDSTSGFNLNKLGAPTYASDVPPGLGSSLSMAFSGSNDQYMNTTGVTLALTDNFGVEAWVKSNGNAAGNAAIVYNGNSASSGWGLYRLGGDYGLLYGGNQLSPVTPISTSWTQLALVRDNGTTTFYVNGVASFTSTGTGPNMPVGGVGIGGSSTTSGFELFDGEIDEVRIFSFQPGQFAVGDLNLPPRAPAPTISVTTLSLPTLALLGLGVLGLAALGLRRRRTNA